MTRWDATKLLFGILGLTAWLYIISQESLLCNLQGSIEKEEQGWLERLGQKEAEMVALKTSISSEAVNVMVPHLLFC